MEQNRKLRNKPHTYSQLIYKKQRQKNEVTDNAETTRHQHAKKISLDTDLTPSTKTNSMWTTDLNVKYKTKKLQEDKFRRKPK